MYKLFIPVILLFSGLLVSFCLTGCLRDEIRTTEVNSSSPTPVLGLKLKVVGGETYFSDFDLTTERVLLVTGVALDSPAHKAGIKVDDILLAMDGIRVRGMRDSFSIMKGKDPGDSILLKISRGKKKIDIVCYIH